MAKSYNSICYNNLVYHYVARSINSQYNWLLIHYRYKQRNPAFIRQDSCGEVPISSNPL